MTKKLEQSSETEPLTVEELERLAKVFLDEHMPVGLVAYYEDLLNRSEAAKAMALFAEFHSRQLWLEAAPWISVSERLPEYGSVSLVYCYTVDDPEKLHFMDIATYSYHGGWYVGMDKQHETAVTHWRELPNPPKAESTPKPSPALPEKP